MKKHIYIMLLAFVVLVLSSCGSKYVKGEFDDDDEIYEIETAECERLSQEKFAVNFVKTGSVVEAASNCSPENILNCKASAGVRDVGYDANLKSRRAFSKECMYKKGWRDQ